jgi:hypothetical protein
MPTVIPLPSPYTPPNCNAVELKIDSLLLQTNASIFKIGITNNPGRRARKHRLPKWSTDETFIAKLVANSNFASSSSFTQAQPWKEMYVLTKDDKNYQNIAGLEACLIQRYSVKRQPPTLAQGWNAIGGGGGRIPQRGPYYLYLLIG